LNSLNENAKPGVKYVSVIQKVMVGTYIALFAKEQHMSRIGCVHKTNNKTGTHGYTGNKGSVSL
jgi:hypothetical protein